MTSTSPLDVAALRQDTPGCTAATTHKSGRPLLHFNNAGCGLQPSAVSAEITAYMHRENTLGGYETERAKAAELDDCYAAVAELINASKPEIAMVGSATQAWQLAAYSVPFTIGDIVATCHSDYGANHVALLQLRKRYDIDIVVLPDTPIDGAAPDVPPGIVDVSALGDLLADPERGPRVKLVSITHLPTNGGVINPCAAIGAAIAHHRSTTRGGLPQPMYLVDACQSVGQVPVDVTALQCDFLSATARKYLRGPRGVGFLYARLPVARLLEPVVIDHFGSQWTGTGEYRLRDDARRFEVLEKSFANLMGLRAAVRAALSVGVDRGSERLIGLARRLRSGLAAVPGVTVHDLGDDSCRGGIVTFLVKGMECITVRDTLQQEFNVNVSVTSPNGTRLDMDRRGLAALVRASVHYYNTEEEVDTFVEIIRGFAAAA